MDTPSIPPDTVALLLAPLLQLGLPGVIILWLGWQKWQADKRIEAMTATIVEMAGKVAAAMAEGTAAINRLSDLVQASRSPT